MTTFTKTQLFSPTEPPVHEGVYERDMIGDAVICEDMIYSYWHKEYGWLNSAWTVEEAANELNMPDFPLQSTWQDLPWRCIVKDAPDEL